MQDEDYSKYIRFDHAAANVDVEPVARLTHEQLESAFAHTFIRWRRTVEPSERSRLWNEMESMVAKLEELSK